MSRELVIQLENDSNEGDEHDDETIVERVLELVSEGYTSGYEPTWAIREGEDEPNNAKSNEG